MRPKPPNNDAARQGLNEAAESEAKERLAIGHTASDDSHNAFDDVIGDGEEGQCERPSCRSHGLFQFRLRWLLAILGDVLSGKLLLQVWMADEALRVGPVMLLAPIAFLLEVGSDLAAALCADLFGHTMFIAPPT
jgi:hypothetical protein